VVNHSAVQPKSQPQIKKFDKLKKFWYNKFRKKKEIQQTNFKKVLTKETLHGIIKLQKR